MEYMTGKKEKLFNLLYEWMIDETCDYCQHLSTFKDEDKRHPCNRCECYELFKLSDIHKKDLKEKVKQITNVIKEE